MKKIALSIAIFSMSLFGCSTAQQVSSADALKNLQTAVVNGCMVVQPTLQAVAVLDPVVMAASQANGLFCAAASTVSVASVQSLIGTGIPAIQGAVTASTAIPADKKPLVQAAIGLFQLTVTNAFAVYGQSLTSTQAAK